MNLIIWDIETEYEKNLNYEEREALADEIASPRTRHLAKKINNWINIITPICLFFIFGFNLIAFAIAFILVDIILCFIDNLVFNYIPYKKAQNISVEKIQKRLVSLENELSYTKKTIDRLQSKYCTDCNYSGYRSFECTKCTEMKILFANKEWLIEHIKADEKYIEKKTEEIKEKEAMVNTKTSKDYSDKMEYFKNMRDKLKYFNKNKDMEFLVPIIKSLTTLIGTLSKKPIGFSLVPTTLYIYLDELQTIIEKLKTLEDEKKDLYVSDINKISGLLSENIASLNSRIHNFEVEDIEVGINVLLQELEKESEDNKDV